MSTAQDHIEHETVGDAGWAEVRPEFDAGPAPAAAIGVIALATDTATESDLSAYLRRDGVGLFVTRVPMSPVATPESLAAMAEHLESAVALLLPGTALDVIAYGCTTGTVAIGADRVAECVHASRPGVAVANPVDAAIKGLRMLRCARVAVLTPYLDSVNVTLQAYFEARGLTLVERASFKQQGDLQMNRISPQCLYETGLRIGASDCDALFISCTGLRTAPVVQRLEDALGKPVVTSNQALSWECLRLAGVREPVSGFGTLFTLPG